jgi:hypothetical protein
MVFGWLRGRCFVCRRLLVFHTLRQQYACEHKPLPISLSDEAHQVIGDQTAEVALRK